MALMLSVHWEAAARSLVILRAGFLDFLTMALMLSVHWEAAARALASESALAGFLAFLGKTTRLALYSFSRCTLACRPSRERFLRRWSTAMPSVRASFLLMP